MAHANGQRSALGASRSVLRWWRPIDRLGRGSPSLGARRLRASNWGGGVVANFYKGANNIGWFSSSGGPGLARVCSGRSSPGPGTLIAPNLSKPCYRLGTSESGSMGSMGLRAPYSSPSTGDWSRLPVKDPPGQSPQNYEANGLPWLAIHQSTLCLALHAHPAIHKDETRLGLFDLPTILRTSSPAPQLSGNHHIAPLIFVDDEPRVNLALAPFQSSKRSLSYQTHLAIQSIGLWPQAQSTRGSPSSAGTDSTGATPNSPRTPSSPTWPPQSFSLHQSSTAKDNHQPSLTGVGEGRCAGPRGQECVGDQAPMSEGGPASRHASRRSSRSPVDDDQISPSSMRYGKHGGRNVRQDLGGVPRTNGESRSQLVPPRTLGVHNMLNPSEPHRLAQGVNMGLPPTSRQPEVEISTSTPGPFTAARPFSTNQPASISLPGTPVGAVTPLGGPSSERNSPTTTFPFPAINNPRRKLSPRNPPEP
ncbi:hypothetical protein G7Z17_g13008 [Cylindrodendrum hubeiense]|uniref:Uncharacterized protein n=1 Tax=Cylindrodendrum hubeiense TaxID=595255 RepID=A0A9P5GT06_9HYPO|nr:hypothetical protein G7Z17_g13008 [Cylindrodendrum hubeiense]